MLSLICNFNGANQNILWKQNTQKCAIHLKHTHYTIPTTVQTGIVICWWTVHPEKYMYIDTLAIYWKVKKSWKNSFSADSRTFDSRRKLINMIIPSVIEVVAMTSIVINTSWFVLIRFIWHLRSHNLWMVQEVISWSTWIWRVHLAWASVHFKQLHWIRS